MDSRGHQPRLVERIQASRGEQWSPEVNHDPQFPLSSRGACTRNAIPTETAAPILAIDLGKYKSVVCLYDATTAQATFTTVRTTQEEIDGLLTGHATAVVVIEACTVSGWVHDLCQSRQVTCVAAKPLEQCGADEVWRGLLHLAWLNIGRWLP